MMMSKTIDGHQSPTTFLNFCESSGTGALNGVWVFFTTVGSQLYMILTLLDRSIFVFLFLQSIHHKHNVLKVPT